MLAQDRMASIIAKVKGFFAAIGRKVTKAVCTIKAKIVKKAKKTRRAKKVVAPVANATPAASAPAPAPAEPAGPAPPTQAAGRKPRAANMRKMKFYKPTRKSGKSKRRTARR